MYGTYYVYIKSGQIHFKSGQILGSGWIYFIIQLVWPIRVFIWNIYLEEYSLQPHET